MKVTAVAENALLVTLANDISESVLPTLQRLECLVEHALGSALVDLVPSYTTLLCFYDVNRMDYLSAMQRVQQAVDELSKEEDTTLTGREVDIPVYYDVSVGYDLKRLASEKQLSVEAIIDLHCSQAYRVFAIGFLPGFGFMGSVDPRLATARQTTPRSAVAAGSVGIADRQTAVYPQQSPGGWNIIGRSPLRLFRPESTQEHPAVLHVGDQVRFRPISQAEFLKMGGALG